MQSEDAKRGREEEVARRCWRGVAGALGRLNVRLWGVFQADEQK
jgi:hypothetical protein